MKVARAGYHVLRLSARDGRGNPLSTSFGVHASGSDYVAWRRENDSKVELVTDRKQYRVGQTARILIKSPFAGAHGLFTVERAGIVSRRPFTLKGTSKWMTVPITRDLIPDAYVSVVLVRGRIKAPGKSKGAREDPGRPELKVGYARLGVSNTDNRLKVSVRPDRTEHRPGQRATVSFEVKDSRGRPARAELTVVVADEGVLSLIGHRTPDPMGVFYADRGLSVRTADNRLRLIQRHVFGERARAPAAAAAVTASRAAGAYGTSSPPRRTTTRKC